MDRRDVLRLLGGVATGSLLAPLSAEQQLGVGRALHAQRRPGRLRTLDPRQADLVRVLADAIIPRTDTPGATDVGVPAFIDLLLAEWYTADERRELFTGLERIDEATRVMGAALPDLPVADRTRLLERLDRERGSLDTAAGAFARIKSLTVYGYFTSREVQTDVLKTVIIPGRYDGCAVPEPGP